MKRTMRPVLEGHAGALQGLDERRRLGFGAVEHGNIRERQMIRRRLHGPSAID